MKSVSGISLIVLLALGTMVSCSILKGNDAEGKIKNYLVRFAVELQQSDSLAATHFKTDQSEWALRSALQLLRNTMESPVEVTTMFQQAFVTINDSILVSIPVIMRTDSAGMVTQRLTNLEMTLQENDTTFVITRWNGENFYEQFWSYSNAITAGQNVAKIRESRGHFYARAKELQETYDSVIWFANTDPVHYYYVVNGTWSNPYGQQLPVEQYRMGLVDDSSKVIVPVEFDLIGMPGELGEDLIEVKNNNRFGCYKLSTGQELIPAEYDWIIPYENILLVKNDTLTGWFDTQQAFHAGYPNKDAEAYVKGFKFLPESIRLDNSDAQYLEIPSESHASVGYLIPASYYTHLGIFDEIEGGFEGEIFNEEAGTEYMEAEMSFLEKITSKLSALITDARDAYVYSREGFYDHQKIAFLNDKGEVVKEHDLGLKGELSFNMVDSTRLEVKVTPGTDEGDGYESEYLGGMSNIPQYTYFSVADDQLIPLESHRWYTFTEFIKLDSSYITGEFHVYNEEQQIWEDVTILPTETLTRMRNEILADYGYIFTDQDAIESFKYNKWYQAKYTSVSEFETELSEIDRHNLKFLEKILGPVDASTAAM